MSKNRKPHRINEETKIEEKHCYDCDQWKALTAYAKSKAVWNGLDRKCKACNKEYRRRNAERLKKKNVEYRKKNKDKIKKWKQENKEHIKTYQDKYMKTWKVKNKEKMKKYFADRYQANKSKINRKARERRANDKAFRLLNNLRSRIGKAITDGIKSDETKNLIGCSINELKNILNNNSMIKCLGDNYGYTGWHIDHIIPCAAFDMTKAIEQKRCFNYRNLQPMWGTENMSKNDTVPDDYEELNDLFPSDNESDEEINALTEHISDLTVSS